MSESYLTEAGATQVHYDDCVLARLQASEGGSGSVRFRIYTPDSRMRVKVALTFVRDVGGSGSIASQGATLYLGEEEQVTKRGRRVLCTDILRDAAGNVIHQSAPLAIPEDPGLEGFSIEFVTAADSILGILAIADATGLFGHWSVQVRFQPDGQRLCDCDWDYVRRKCSVSLVGVPLTLP